jgi:hypothetical protein
LRRTLALSSKLKDIVRKEIVEMAITNCSDDLDLPSSESVRLSERKTEMFWDPQGRIIYIAIRRYVYAASIPDHLDDIVRDTITAFLNGSKALMPKPVPAPAR